MGSERCSLLHRHPAAGVGGLEMAVGFQNSKFLSVHFFSIYHTGVYPKYQASDLQVRSCHFLVNLVERQCTPVLLKIVSGRLTSG